jgi:hypothetical protein
MTIEFCDMVERVTPCAPLAELIPIRRALPNSYRNFSVAVLASR